MSSKCSKLKWNSEPPNKTRLARECAIITSFPWSMASTRGQNVHLVSSQIIPSRQLVVSSSYLVESSSHLVVLPFNSSCRRVISSCRLSTRRVAFQLLVSRFNSSCRLSTRRVAFQLLVHGSWKKRGPKGPGYHN